jgi:hypothetical protein
MAIEGVSHSTVIALMSEIGYEGIKKFETPKQFSSWLRLSPNTKRQAVRLSAVTCLKEAYASFRLLQAYKF